MDHRKARSQQHDDCNDVARHFIHDEFLSFHAAESGREPETLGDCGLWLDTDETFDELAVFEDEHGGYARDLKTRCYLGIVIDGQFCHSILPLRLGSKLVHNWTNDPARSTPRGPTINQHRLPLRRQNLALKRLICNHQRLSIVGDFQLFSAPAALRLTIRQSSFVHTILRFTVTANNNDLHSRLFHLAFRNSDSPSSANQLRKIHSFEYATGHNYPVCD